MLEDSMEKTRNAMEAHERVFLDMWDYKGKAMDDNFKDMIGIAYLKHVVGVNESTANDFIDGKVSAYNAIGMKHHSRISMRLDCTGFWDEVKKITGDGYSSVDLTCLERYTEYGVLIMMNSISPRDRSTSRVMKKIWENIYAFCGPGLGKI